MLFDTLTPRHWEMTLLQPGAVAAAAACGNAVQQQAHSSESSGLTKNQKKKAKRKAKKAAATAADQEVRAQAGMRKDMGRFDNSGVASAVELVTTCTSLGCSSCGSTRTHRLAGSLMSLSDGSFAGVCQHGSTQCS